MIPSPPEGFPYLVDLHVHTRAYSPCAELLDPFSLDEAMAKKGIQGVVLTEHDVLWPDDELEHLRRRLTGGRRIYRGIEVSCKEGHFIVVGKGTGRGLKAGMSISTLLEVVHGAGGVVIWAHPFRPARAGDPCLHPLEAPETLDAVEVFSTVTKGEASHRAREVAMLRGWHTVAGSDAHALDAVGEAVTGFIALPADEAALASAIRNGDVVAMRVPFPPKGG